MMNYHLLSVKLAHAAYCETRKETYREVCRYLPGCRIRHIRTGVSDLEGFVAREGNNLYLFFAGTESYRDMVRDLRFTPGRYQIGDVSVRIHGGFARGIKELIPRVAWAIRDLYFYDPRNLKHCRRVISGGHSLGAPLSQGALDAVWHNFPELRGRTYSVTFGRPNGWGKGSARGFEARHEVINFVNRFDVVTYALHFTTHSPGDTRDFVLPGKWGHSLTKYDINMEALYHGHF